MTQWIITFNKDENTTKLEMEADTQPDMEQALAFVSAYAQQHYDRLEGTVEDKGLEGPAQDLLKRFGITLTGIVKRQ